MKPCKACNRTDVPFSFTKMVKNGKQYDSGKLYVTCDLCRTALGTQKKVCTQCGENKSLRDYYVKGGAAHRLCSECKVCTLKRKQKYLPSYVAPKPEPVQNAAVNAFHWREFVQPVPMKAGKWEQQPRPDQEINTRFTQYF